MLHATWPVPPSRPPELTVTVPAPVAEPVPPAFGLFASRFPDTRVAPGVRVVGGEGDVSGPRTDSKAVTRSGWTSGNYTVKRHISIALHGESRTCGARAVVKDLNCVIKRQ